MEKSLKIIRLIAVLLIIVFIIVIGFVGVYARTNGIWGNVLPEYNLGIDLDGYSELHFELDTTEDTKDIYVDENGNYKGDVIKQQVETSSEESTSLETSVVEKNPETEYKIENRTIPRNDPSKINIENFEKTKKIIQKRLENYNLYEYNIRQDSVTGKIILEVPTNSEVDLKASLVTTIGKLEFIDSETGVLLLEDSNLKNASPYVMTNENGEYEVYMQLDFDEAGKQILEKITGEYVQKVDESGNVEAKTVEVRLDGQTLIVTSFKEPVSSGTIHVPMGDTTTDYNEYYQLVESVQEVANLLNEEKLPLVYKITDEVGMQSVVTKSSKNIAIISYAVVALIISVYMIIKYKLEGLKQAIFNVGYLATLLIVIRYTNITITFNSLIALIALIAINYIFSIKFLNKFKEEKNQKIALKGALKELYLAIIPVIIIAVIFTFMSAVVINSVGMTFFWGLIVQALFSLLTLV